MMSVLGKKIEKLTKVSCRSFSMRHNVWFGELKISKNHRKRTRKPVITMAKKIFKYQLETTDVQQVEIQQGAEILCVQTQNEKPCIWALVTPENDKVKRTFEIFGTGFSVPENGIRSYIGTYQLNDGALVFHCFELIGLR